MLDGVVDRIPEGIPMSDHLKGKCKSWLKVMLFGQYYYMPVTPELKGVIEFVGVQQTCELMRDSISAVYMQIRDTVGAGIQMQLQQQIAEGFNNLFDKKLAQAIDVGFQKQIGDS